MLPGSSDRSRGAAGRQLARVVGARLERTRPSSGSFEALRRFADYSPLTRPMVDRARSVARRAVIIKGARYSKDLSKLGLTPLPAPGHATVQWARV